MPHRTTYYSEQELEALEAKVELQDDDSFSSVVREACREYWEIGDE